MNVQILDWVLGHNEALFRRAQLKALVSIHSQEVSQETVSQSVKILLLCWSQLCQFAKANPTKPK